MSIRSMKTLKSTKSIRDMAFLRSDLNSVLTKELDEHTIQGSILLFSYHSNWAHYSREYIIQGGILFEEIRYIHLQCKVQKNRK